MPVKLVKRAPVHSHLLNILFSGLSAVPTPNFVRSCREGGNIDLQRLTAVGICSSNVAATGPMPFRLIPNLPSEELNHPLCFVDFRPCPRCKGCISTIGTCLRDITNRDKKLAFAVSSVDVHKYRANVILDAAMSSKQPHQSFSWSTLDGTKAQPAWLWSWPLLVSNRALALRQILWYLLCPKSW